MTRPAKKKLIEVALPLDAINAASAREKSIRHGHPSTLHLWWARRPLAAARAVIFAQMVDDPSANPDLFPTEKKQSKERKRLFGIIEELVKWENTTNEAVLERARAEIWQSWRRACAENADHPRAKELFDRNKLPAFHDPFAGGGALPLEAQRLGLQAPIDDSWLTNCARLYFVRLVEIIQPRAIAILGLRPSLAALRCFGIKLPTSTSMSVLFERGPFAVRGDTLLFPVYHCGARGVNMNRPLEHQLRDWAHIGSVLTRRS